VFRRFVTLLLIVTYVAGQLATMPHAHAVSIAGHGARPHVHTNSLARLLPGNGHSQHNHDHGGSHEHSHYQVHEHRCSHEAPNDTPAPRDDRGHDADCVYLSDSLIAQASVSWDNCTQVAGDADLLDALFDDGPDLAAFRSFQTHGPPDVVVSGRQLLLKLRTLRI
jgi:hypothetical protein